MGVVALYFVDYVVKVFIVVEMMATRIIASFIFIAASLIFYRVRAQRSRWE
jgi:hypothetical protein